MYISHVSDPDKGGSTGLSFFAKAMKDAYEVTFRTLPLPTELDNWLDYVIVHIYNTTPHLREIVIYQIVFDRAKTVLSECGVPIGYVDKRKSVCSRSNTVW